MRAAVFERTGLDNLKIKNLPEPKPGAGEALVRLRAASLNYRDTLIAIGGYGARQRQSKRTCLTVHLRRLSFCLRRACRVSSPR